MTHELADELLEGAGGQEADFLRAWADVLSRDPERVAAGAESLSAVVGAAESSLRPQAAFVLLEAAIRDPKFEWSDAAENVVAEGSPATAAPLPRS